MRDLCKAIRRICPPEQQSLIITVNYAHNLALMGNLQFAKQRFLKCSQFRRRLLISPSQVLDSIWREPMSRRQGTG